MPLSRTNAIEVFSGVKPWIAESRMLVAYAVPRKANMPTTVTIEAIAKARLREQVEPQQRRGRAPLGRDEQRRGRRRRG